MFAGVRAFVPKFAIEVWVTRAYRVELCEAFRDQGYRVKPMRKS
jgi:hypothetical protein